MEDKMEENKTEEKEEFQIWFGKIGIRLPKNQDSIDIARTLLDTLEKNLNGTSPIQGQKECSCTRCVTDRHEHSVPAGQQTQAYPVISSAGKEGLLALVEQGVWRIQEVPKFTTIAPAFVIEGLEVYLNEPGEAARFKRASTPNSVYVKLDDMRKLLRLNQALRIAAYGYLAGGKKDALRYALRLWDKIELALSGQPQTPQSDSLLPEDIKNSPEQEEIQDNISKPLEDSPDKKTTMQNNNLSLSLKIFQEDQGFDYSAVQPRWVGKLRVYYGNSNGQLVIKHSERSVTSEILRTTEGEIDRLRQYSEEDLNAVIRGINRDKQHLLRIYLHELDGVLRD